MEIPNESPLIFGLYKPFGFNPRRLKAIESRVESRRVTLVQSWLRSS